MPKVEDARKHASLGISIVCGAQPKTGKTFFGASAAQNWEAKDLSDVYFMQFDSGGTRGLVEYGCKIPHMWDFSGIKDEALVPELTKCLDDVIDCVATKGVKTVVVDTISELAQRAEKYALTITKGQDMWNHVAAIHQRLVHTLARVSAHKIYLTHWKENFADDNAKKASGVAGDSQIVIAVSGRGANAYKQSADIIGQLTKTTLKGQPARRAFKPHGAAGFEGGSRLACLAGSEPADAAAVIKKITGSLDAHNV
jgi:hypothetical protein